MSEHTSASTPAEPFLEKRSTTFLKTRPTTAERAAAGARVLAWPAADLRQQRRRRPDQWRRASFVPERAAAAA